MSVFRGFAILLALAFVAFEIFMSYDSVSQQPAPGHVIAGEVSGSLVFTLVHSVSRPIAK
jgi:hypothetical protein